MKKTKKKEPKTKTKKPSNTLTTDRPKKPPKVP